MKNVNSLRLKIMNDEISSVIEIFSFFGGYKLSAAVIKILIMIAYRHYRVEKI